MDTAGFYVTRVDAILDADGIRDYARLCAYLGRREDHMLRALAVEAGLPRYDLWERHVRGTALWAVGREPFDGMTRAEIDAGNARFGEDPDRLAQRLIDDSEAFALDAEAVAGVRRIGGAGEAGGLPGRSRAAADLARARRLEPDATGAFLFYLPDRDEILTRSALEAAHGRGVAAEISRAAEAGALIPIGSAADDIARHLGVGLGGHSRPDALAVVRDPWAAMHYHDRLGREAWERDAR